MRVGDVHKKEVHGAHSVSRAFYRKNVIRFAKAGQANEVTLIKIMMFSRFRFKSISFVLSSVLAHKKLVTLVLTTWIDSWNVRN